MPSDSHAPRGEVPRRVNDILAEHDLALSVQVLQEFYVQVTNPFL